MAVSPASDTRILVPREIATTLGAGIHSVTVIHEVPLGRDGVPHRAVESDAYRFVLRPGIEIVPPDDGDTDIRVTFTPPLQDGQDVRLLLNELLDPPPEDRPKRRFYEITSTGREMYGAALRERENRRASWLRPAPQTGSAS